MINGISMHTDETIAGAEANQTCSCGEMHKGHICWLTHMGLIMEVQHISNNPKVSCLKCGAKANLAHNVCHPSAQ